MKGCTQEALAAALSKLPWKLLKNGASRWTRVIGDRCSSSREPALARWISLRASDPKKLKKMIESMDREERRLLALVKKEQPFSALNLALAAVFGFGDLTPALERCAALGVAVPVYRRFDEYREKFWSFDGKIEEPLLLINVEAPSVLFSLPSMEDKQEVIRLVSTVESAEVVTTVSYAQTMAKLFSVAGVLASEPLALTASAKIAKKEIKRLDREIGFDPIHSADFFLSLLAEMGLLTWVDHGQRQRLGFKQGGLSDLREKDGLENGLRTSLASPFEFLNLRSGDGKDPLSLESFYSPTEDSEQLEVLQHQFWWILQIVLSRSLPVGSFFDLNELCRTIVEALPPWVLGRHTRPYKGKESWVVSSDGKNWAIYFFQLMLARMMLRLGFVELGVHSGDIEAADRAKAPCATCPRPLEGWDGISFPAGCGRLIPRMSGILARTTPAWDWVICNRAPEKAAVGGSLHLGGDLEIHADLEAMDFNRSVLLYLAAEDLPAAPGDRIRRFRMTQKSVGRALLAGASKESIRELVEASQPPAPESVRRRIEEWLRSIGALTLYGGWILGEWRNEAARDAAVIGIQGARPVGELWAILPPKELENVRIEVLPAPILRLDSTGAIVLSTGAPKAAEKALSTVASPQADHRLSFEASTLKSLNLTSSRVAKALSYWSADPKQLREFLDHEIRRLSGVIRTLPWWEGRVLHFDSASIARKVCADLIKGGKPALDLGGGAILELNDLTSLRKIVELEGFKLEKSEDFSKLPFALGGSAYEEGARGPKTQKGTFTIDGRMMDCLSGRSLRKRLEQAMSAQSSLKLLLRPDGRSAFRLIEAVPIDVFSAPPLMVVLESDDLPEDQSALIIPIYDIAAVSWPE